MSRQIQTACITARMQPRRQSAPESAALVHAAWIRPRRDGLVLADVALQQVQGMRLEAGQGLGSLLLFHRTLALELRILPVGYNRVGGR